MHIDDAKADSFFFQFLCRDQGFVYHETAGDYCCVASVFHTISLAQLNIRSFIIENRDVESAQADVCGAVFRRDLSEELLCGNSICRMNHCHPRNDSHQSQILDTLMAGAVFPYGDSRVSRTDFYVCLRISDGITDDLVSSACGEHRESAGKYRLAGEGQTRGHAHHIGFRDAGVEKPLRKFLFESRCHSGF